MKQGKVYLVGAGPGDPKLITLKGLECIKQADVLVYDRLVAKRLLAHAKEGCELIFGGKYPDNHILRQNEINDVLVEKALEGKVVTRLKGGDPFVFGRGGEEAESLAEAGIPFEVVPGITSAVSVPAYAGIPVTHRDFTTSFAVITGHLDFNKAESSIRWDKISEAHGTLIFLMGMEKLAMIMAKLQEHGRSSTTPVALVRWGTTADQKTITGTLENIVERAKANNFGSPAVVVVGEVVNLREKLKWFENKPLFGKRIVVTRASTQAGSLADKIEALGGEAWECPVIKIVPPADYSPVDDAIARLKEFSWLVFTSVNGVEFFFKRLRDLGKDIRELAGIKLCAIGPATKQAVENYQLLVDLVPDEFVAEGVLDKLRERLGQSDRILLPRAEVAREVLPETIAGWGIPIEVVPVYRTIQGDAQSGQLLEMLKQNSIDVVTFTSSSTVKNFVKLIGKDKLEEALKNVTIASIGPITSQTARDLGLPVHVEAEKYTIDGLLEAILEYYRRCSH
ncbi:MAG TPA: uroporphyrinogen-III C-methyltransferase [Verrucomicrobiae bacterium]|nr:uroporphyrinogen-III C-methyltransferase [Verrucomicrobiae bacterium]